MGLDDQPNDEEDFLDDEAPWNFDEGAGPSIKRAVNRHNNVVQHAVRKYGEFLITNMLDQLELWAEGTAEGQREVVERDGARLVYINGFIVTEYKIGMDEFPSSGRADDWPENIKNSIMDAAKEYMVDLVGEVQEDEAWIGDLDSIPRKDELQPHEYNSIISVAFNTEQMELPWLP